MLDNVRPRPGAATDAGDVCALLLSKSMNARAARRTDAVGICVSIQRGRQGRAYWGPYAGEQVFALEG